MATDRKACNSRITLGIEPTFNGTPASTSSQLPILEGGAGLKQVPSVRASKMISLCGSSLPIIKSRPSRGAVNYEPAWDYHGRAFYGAFGTIETDDLTTEYDNFFYIPGPGTARKPKSLEVGIYSGNLKRTYKGALTNTFTIAQSGDEPVTFTANYEALPEARSAYSDANNIPTNFEESLLKSTQLTAISAFGTDITTLVSSWSVEGNWNVSTGDKISSSAEPRVGDFTSKITLGIDWTDEVYKPSDGTGILSNFYAEPRTTGVFSIALTDGTAEFFFYCPAVGVEGDPPTGDQRGTLTANLVLIPTDGTVAVGALGTVGAGSNAQYLDCPMAMRWSGQEDGSTY